MSVSVSVSLSVCLSVFVSGYAFRHMGLKLDMGLGNGFLRLKSRGVGKAQFNLATANGNIQEVRP